MHLVTLLRTISAGSLRRMVLMALVAGLSNALVLALINSAADRGAIRSGANVRLAVIFAIVVVLYTISQRFLLFTAAKQVESLIHRIRVRLIEAVRHSELADIDRIGRSRIFNAASKEIQTLAQSSATLATVVQMSGPRNLHDALLNSVVADRLPSRHRVRQCRDRALSQSDETRQ